MTIPPIAFWRTACIVAHVVCAVLIGTARDAEAQPGWSVDKTQARGLARVCGRTGTLAACVDAVRGRFASFADLVLAELQAAPAAAPTSSSRVVWDGTFAHPDAPSFYLLKSYALLDAQTSPEACARLPPALQADRQLLLTLTCSAENQLRAAGPDRWPDENREFEGLRRLLSSCLPDPVAGANPCARP
jgi:hypothetical protein